MPATGTNRSRACDMFRCATPPTNISDETSHRVHADDVGWEDVRGQHPVEQPDGRRHPRARDEGESVAVLWRPPSLQQAFHPRDRHRHIRSQENFRHRGSVNKGWTPPERRRYRTHPARALNASAPALAPWGPCGLCLPLARHWSNERSARLASVSWETRWARQNHGGGADTGGRRAARNGHGS